MDNPLISLLLGTSAPSQPLPPNASLQLRYEFWLRDNHRWLLPLLDAARSLTLFMPGRFQEGGQLSSEGIYTFLNVISVYHDHLLDKPRVLTAEIKLDPQGETAGWLKMAQGVLLFTHYTEVFIEMMGKRTFKPIGAPEGTESRGSWMCIAAVEAIKAFCRLSMLRANRGKMLLPPSEEEMVLDLMASIRSKQKAEILERERREYDEYRKQNNLPPLSLTSDSTPTVHSTKFTPDIENPASASASHSIDTTLVPIPSSLPPNSSFSPFPLTPGHLPPLQIQSLIDLYVRHGRTTSADSKLGRPHGRFVVQARHPHEEVSYSPPVTQIVSEILHIIRPVVYTLARAHYASTEYTPEAAQSASWTPIILSMSVDAASRALGPKLSQLSVSEFQEVSKRIRNYFFYLLRDPLFSKVVAAPLLRFSDLLNRIPLIGGFFSGIISLIANIQRYYFYTSAS